MNRMEELEKTCAANVKLQESMLDINRLLIECVTRIAQGSPNARKDAHDTLRGCGVIALEGML